MLSLNLPQISIPTHAIHRGSGGRIKAALPCPEGRPFIIESELAKIACPAQRHGEPKRSISAAICWGFSLESQKWL
jgi:hypothetical protein